MSALPPVDVALPGPAVGRPGAPALDMAPTEGRVSRRIFTDPRIFELELEEIFAKAWFFVAHESEIPSPGDMVSRPVGADRAVVVRDDGGRVRAFLNSCRHRGMRLCRTDRANARFLRCPYHGWTYANDGSLVLVPTEEHYGPGELEKEALGLIPVADLAVHQGLIFATWDPRSPSLTEYLGDMAFYLDVLFGRTDGGIEIVGGPQVWEVETGWKFATDNFTDNFHVFQTHHSLVELGLLPPDPDFAAGGTMVVAGNGHIMHFTEGPPSDEFRGFGLPRVLRDQFGANLSPAQHEVIERSGLSAGTVWPNFHWLQLLVQSDPGLPITPVLNLRLEEPVSPTRTRMWSWFAVDRGADEAFRRVSFETYVRTFGPSGICDQDDMENWEDCTRANVGPVAKRFSLHHGMGLGRPIDSMWPGPGTAYQGAYGEMTQRAWYEEWWRRMGPVVGAEVKEEADR